MNVKSGTYYADVVDLAMANYYWDQLMDLEDDSDSDGMVRRRALPITRHS